MIHEDRGEGATPAKRDFYPELEAYRTGFLQASARHRIYFEESGRPDGFPVLFIHGGPGGYSSPAQRRFFDPEHYRIVLFDQRGCGKSTPHADLEENTTWHLVSDIEALRKELGIERWLLFGGSWGSTLALAYAESYPDRVAGLILRGIFMLRRREIQWFYQAGASEIFPDAWEEYLRPIPEPERSDLVGAYHRRLTSDEPAARRSAALAWAGWENRTSYLVPPPEDDPVDEKASLAVARIECHYASHGGFFTTERQLLDGIASIRRIPAVIVQGRYDLVCPMRTAWELHQEWPEADFRVVPTGGHSAFDPDIRDALLAATDRFRDSQG
ncbi:MAG TPA: prolyl aminopeptidase [Thermoanaerobaculia bacterium]